MSETRIIHPCKYGVVHHDLCPCRKELESSLREAREEVARLKADGEKAFATSHDLLMELRDDILRWKSLAEKMREALERITRVAGSPTDECESWSIATEALTAYADAAKEK